MTEKTVSCSNEGPPQRKRNLVPILAEGIGTRISAAADLLTTRKYAASVMGVSPDALQRYIREENMPSFGAVAALCLAARVRMEWLASGEGPMKVDDPKPAPAVASHDVREPDAPMDSGLLAAAVRITDEVLRQYQVRDRVDSDGFAELVRIVYQDLAYGRAEDAASAALARILAINRRTPP